MAEEFSKVLIAPDGSEFVARSPIEANDLMFGSGYKEKSVAKPANGDKAKPATPAAKPGEVT